MGPSTPGGISQIARTRADDGHAAAQDSPRSMRRITDKLLAKAAAGDLTAMAMLAERTDGKVAQISTAVPPIFFQHQQWPDSTSRSILTAAYFRFSAATIQGNRPEKQCVLLGF